MFLKLGYLVANKFCYHFTRPIQKHTLAACGLEELRVDLLLREPRKLNEKTQNHYECGKYWQWSSWKSASWSAGKLSDFCLLRLDSTECKARQNTKHTSALLPCPPSTSPPSTPSSAATAVTSLDLLPLPCQPSPPSRCCLQATASAVVEMPPPSSRRRQHCR
jgi:hypothetical protein